MFPLIGTAHAMAPSGGQGDPGGFGLMGMMALIFGIFYFMMIRPQQKRAKEQREMNAALSKGDEVITDAGIFGTVQKVGDDHVTLEIAPKVTIRVVRSRVAERVKETKTKESAKEAKAREIENSKEGDK